MKKITALLIICLFCACLPAACNTTEENPSADDEYIQSEAQKEEFSTDIYVSGDDVTTGMGFHYTCQGFNGRCFAATGAGLQMNLNINGRFNKYTLIYYASEPVKAIVHYGVDATETVFLEAQTGEFSSFIDGYLDGILAENVSCIEVFPCKESAEFLLYNFVCSECEIFDDDVYYIENDKYKLGIYLAQGGGLSYLVDKQASIPYKWGINLLNNFDTGRLVQQSYYGSDDNDTYTAGDFNNSHWCYNPVQGGDKYGNESKIVDIAVTPTSVYIKCQPQDWSLDGQITPSYMESTYTIYDDRIETSCRFVDFSGYTHRYCDQELPAFYCLSHFDTFTYYGGQSSWTGDELTVKENLGFWGEPDIAPSCRFQMNGNTETWCSWTNSTTGFGIGLYTPGISELYAGRCEGDKHSLSSADGSCSYVAPLFKYELKSYEPFEYSYMLTTGNVADIRNTFGTYKDFATESSLQK